MKTSTQTWTDNVISLLKTGWKSITPIHQWSSAPAELTLPVYLRRWGTCRVWLPEKLAWVSELLVWFWISFCSEKLKLSPISVNNAVRPSQIETAVILSIGRWWKNNISRNWKILQLLRRTHPFGGESGQPTMLSCLSGPASCKESGTAELSKLSSEYFAVKTYQWPHERQFCYTNRAFIDKWPGDAATILTINLWKVNKSL